MNTSLEEMEQQARLRIPIKSLGYYTAGANGEVSLSAMKDAYSQVKITSRAECCDEIDLDTRTKLFGTDLSSPIAVPSMAFHKLANPVGEVATAKAA